MTQQQQARRRQPTHRPDGPIVTTPPPAAWRQSAVAVPPALAPASTLALLSALLACPAPAKVVPAGGSSRERRERAAVLENGVAFKAAKRTKRQFPGKMCVSCRTDVTSQWRSGPAGPSTLCNACGIRHRRLLYRSGENGHRTTTAKRADDGLVAGDPLLTEGPVVPAGLEERERPKRSSVYLLLN